MKHSFLAFFLFIFWGNTSIYAQTGWQWAKEDTYTGSSDNPFQDSWLAVLAPGGDGVYVATAVGSQSSTPAMAGTVTHCGALSVVDSTNCGQMIIAKIDSDGNYIWATATQHSSASPLAITSDASGNVYVYGVYDSATLVFDGVSVSHVFLPYHKMGFIAKLDPSGHVLWMSNVINTFAGGIGDISFAPGSINVDIVGGVYVGGEFWGTETLGSSTITSLGIEGNLFLAKFSPSGIPLWAKSFDSTQGGAANLCSAMSPSGHLYLAGTYLGSSTTFGSYTLTNTTGDGIFITRFDTAGNTVWAKSASANWNDVTNFMTLDAAENIYFTGGFQNSQIAFGTDTLHNVAPGSLDVYIASYDSAGHERWAKSAGGSANDQGLSLGVDGKGHLWTVGNMNNGFYTLGYTATFGTLSLTESGGTILADPLYIAKYDTTGHPLSVSYIYGGGDDQAIIIPDNRGNFYLSGDWFSTTQAFGPDTLKPGLEEQTFVAKYRYDTAYYTLNTVSLEQPHNQITMYPNPASRTLNISGTVINSVAVSDLTGRTIYSREYDAANVAIDVSGWARGIYIVKVNGYIANKFLKE